MASDGKKAGSEKASPPIDDRVRILNGRKVGRLFVAMDTPIEPGESALVDRDLAARLEKVGGIRVKVED